MPQVMFVSTAIIFAMTPLQRIASIVLACMLSGTVYAQETTDTTHRNVNGEKITLLTYVRVISSAKGQYRFDQNIVPNIRLNKWLRLEAGIRFGERPGRFNAYYHYKLELQTRRFWNTVRVLARISDNVIRYPSPSYRKTNELFAVEGRIKALPSLQLLGGGGYLFSAQQNHNTEALPTRQGDHNDYFIFKLSARYLLDKGFLETTFGSYDTFNPYEPDKPFFQESFEYDMPRHCTAYSYFRYQYDGDVLTPNNYFLCIGVRVPLAL